MTMTATPQPINDVLTPDMNSSPHSVSTHTMQTDLDVWTNIIHYKLDGVGFHVQSMIAYLHHDMKGYAKMHEYHARQEFNVIVHVIGDCVEHLGGAPIIDLTKIYMPEITIYGSNLCEKATHGLEIYENWEDKTYSNLKEYKHHLHETGEYVDHLIQDVREEREFIHYLWKNMEKHNYDEHYLKELDKMLYKYYEKKMG